MIIRIRSPNGLKRLTVDEETVGDLKRIIVSKSIFIARGTDFGLKLEGKRKHTNLDDSSVKLSSLKLEEGSILLIDFAGRSQYALNEEAVDEYGLLVDHSAPPKTAKRKSACTRNVEDCASSPKEKAKRKSVEISHEVDSSMSSADLLQAFMDGEVMTATPSTKNLGSFLFNQFTTAARIDSLEKGKVEMQANYCSQNTGLINDYTVSYVGSNGKPFEEHCSILDKVLPYSIKYDEIK